MPLKRRSVAGKLVLAGVLVGTPGGALAALAYLGGELTGFGTVLFVLLIAGIVAAGLGLLLFTAGVAVHVFAPLRPPNRPQDDHQGYGTILGSLYLALAAAYLLVGLYVAGPTLLGAEDSATTAARTPTPNHLLLAALAPELCMLAVLYLRIIRPGVITWRDMGLTRERLTSRLGIGVLTAVAALLLMASASYALRLLGVEQTQWQLFAVLRQASPLQFVLMLLIASPLTALVEESFFRGYIFRGLYAAKGPRQAYLVGAAIFAIAHGNLPAFPPLFVAALLLAYVYRRTGTVVPAMIAHAVVNGLALLAISYSPMA